MRDSRIVAWIGQGEAKRNRAVRALLSKSSRIPKKVHQKTRISKEIVEECYHDAVLVLLDKLEAGKFEMQREGRLKGFLYQVTYRLVLRAMKKELAFRMLRLGHEDEEAIIKQAVEMQMRAKTLLDEMLDAEWITVCRKVISEIGPRCHSILFQVYVQNIPMAVVAENMDLSLENIRTCKFRCLKSVRKILIEKGIWHYD